MSKRGRKEIELPKEWRGRMIRLPDETYDKLKMMAIRDKMSHHEKVDELINKFK